MLLHWLAVWCSQPCPFIPHYLHPSPLLCNTTWASVFNVRWVPWTLKRRREVAGVGLCGQKDTGGTVQCLCDHWIDSGMSSFINALWVIGHEEETSALTRVVRTTQTPTSYSSSHSPNMVLWNLPGTRTATQSLESYLEEIQFSKYDLFLIIASKQISMNLVRLAKTTQRLGKRFSIIQTKLNCKDLSTSAISEEWLLQNKQENNRKTHENQ